MDVEYDEVVKARKFYLNLVGYKDTRKMANDSADMVLSELSGI